MEKKIAVGDAVRCGGYWTVSELRADRVLVGCVGVEFSASRLVWVADKDCWVRCEDHAAVVAELAAEAQLVELCRIAVVS